MASRKKAVDPEIEAFHRDLLESVQQMRAGQAARKTRVKMPPVKGFMPKKAARP